MKSRIERGNLSKIVIVAGWALVLIAMKLAQFNFRGNPIFSFFVIVLLIVLLVINQNRESKLNKKRQEIRKQNVEMRKDKEKAYEELGLWTWESRSLRGKG